MPLRILKLLLLAAAPALPHAHTRTHTHPVAATALRTGTSASRTGPSRSANVSCKRKIVEQECPTQVVCDEGHKTQRSSAPFPYLLQASHHAHPLYVCTSVLIAALSCNLAPSNFAPAPLHLL